jgi:nicotinamidase-related amidase
VEILAALARRHVASPEASFGQPLVRRAGAVLSRRISDVFLDVCTQRDYLSPDGARRIVNADRITTNIKHLMALARWARLPTLSCVDACRPHEVRGVPHPFCVLGTLGQQKIPCSLLPDRVVIESDNCLCVSLDLLLQHQQAILVKGHRDPFTNPKLDRLLTEMPTRRYVVFGVSLETSIRPLVLGLLLRRRHVTLVPDACGYWNYNEAEMTLRQLAAKGCQMLTTQQMVSLKRAGRLGLRHPRFVA